MGLTDTGDFLFREKKHVCVVVSNRIFLVLSNYDLPSSITQNMCKIATIDNRKLKKSHPGLWDPVRASLSQVRGLRGRRLSMKTGGLLFIPVQPINFYDRDQYFLT